MDAEQSSYTFSNPAMTATPLEFSMLTPPASDIPATIKMEDLHSAPSPAAVPEAAPATPSAATSSTTHKSQPKKRKSWGQVLPEPKTNLPPRKRAKTADEKEQRRIERVKRNRLAAHNSRERKREEMERLTAERDHWKNSLDRFFAYTKQLEDQISWYRSHAAEQLPIVPRIIDGIEMPPQTVFSPAPSPSPAPTSAPTSTPAVVTTSADNMATEREGSVASTTINPRRTSFTSPAMKAESAFGSPAMNNSSYASPESMEDYDSPINSSSQPPTPRNDELSFAEPDQTQHSAAMLCDLQCRSASRLGSSTTLPASLLTFPWAITYLILLNLRLSMTLLRSSICQRTLQIIQRTASSTPLSPQNQWDPSAFMSTLVHSLMTCTPTQAQQFLLATGLAPLRKPSFRVAGKASGSSGIFRERDTRRAVRQFRRLSSSIIDKERRTVRGRESLVQDSGHFWQVGLGRNNLPTRV
ncbi:transcriptional activator hac1 [Diplodia corticola]|uniref:Transcriptional activator hac1 n=1 Tax=Diplodia corticola TaxID=236234 RepID=A0A1J9RH35_9PEZI|nr:transcriptional activator hac1 [Diplodia corticola]OJD39912.1 transcriptional activator hac1 [Diplodia corticola]